MDTGYANVALSFDSFGLPVDAARSTRISAASADSGSVALA